MRSIERSRWFPLAGITLLALLLRVGTAVMFPNVHRPDEMFQNLEPAYRMLFGHGIVTWEWVVGIRSPVFPGFLAGVMGLAAAAGAGPGGSLLAVTVVLSLLSAGVVAAAFDLGWRQAGLAGALVCGVLCAFWPDLVYFGPKPLGEVQAGHLLLLAAYAATVARGRGGLVLAGLLLGLCFAVRFQLAPALAVVALGAGRLDWRRWMWVAAGAALPVLGMGAADWAFWGAPFQSVWLNFRLNLVADVAGEFGRQPLGWYASRLLFEWGAAVVPIGVAFVLGVRRAPLLAAVAVVVVLSHTAIAHKEISFIYAALPAMAVVCGLGTVAVLDWLGRGALAPRMVLAAGLAALWAGLGATTAVGGGFRANWRAGSAVLLAERSLRNDPALCGLGFRWPAVPWYDTGAHVYLGRDVPMYAFGSPAGITRVAPAINAALGGPDVAEGLPGFTLAGCWPGGATGEVCVARAARTTCTADPTFELNAVPQLGRMDTRFGADRP